MPTDKKSYREKYSTFWWQAPENELNNFIFDAINYIDDKQSYRTTSDLRHLRLYGNTPIDGLSSKAYARPSASFNRLDSNLSLNIVHSMVSTIVSKIMKNRPRPMFLTSGGNWTMKRKAKMLNKFTQGLFYASDIYKIGEEVVRDSCIFGTGFMKIYEDNKEITVERVLPHEILVDDSESIYGEPRQMFQRKMINREVLISVYPEYAGEIIRSSGDTEESSISSPDAAIFDGVEVIEAWHLPSTRNAGDGRHTICIATAVLLDEEYTKPYFPFVNLKWSSKALGFWGQGMAEQLTGLQIEINKLLKTIQIAMHLVSVPKVFVERGSKVSKSHLNNEIGGIIEYAGTAPIYKTAQAISPEMFSHLDRLYQRAYEIVGVSQLSASSRKPAGLESGRALREFSDIESERFLSFARSYESMFLNAAKIMIDIARDVSSRGGDFSVTSFDRSNLEKVSWKSVDLAEDQYIMQVFPTSLLPVTPAARLQTVEEMMRTGLLSREDGLALLDFPDLNSVQSLETAAYDEIEMIIESIVENGVYFSPEPFTNLPFALKKMNQAYTRSKLDGVPEDRLSLMRRYISECQNLLSKAMQAEQQQQMAMMQAQTAAQQQAQQQSAPQLEGVSSQQTAPSLAAI
jgi:hypothetical protein